MYNEILHVFSGDEDANDHMVNSDQSDNDQDSQHITSLPEHASHSNSNQGSPHPSNSEINSEIDSYGCQGSSEMTGSNLPDEKIEHVAHLRIPILWPSINEKHEENNESSHLDGKNIL